MLDLKYIRENGELVKQAVANKRENADVDALLALDIKRREYIGKVESARADQNKATQTIANMKKSGYASRILALNDCQNACGMCLIVSMRNACAPRPIHCR